MNYQKMTDFELELLVAKHFLGEGNYSSDAGKLEVYRAGMDGGDFLPNAYFSPITSWGDAGLIIAKHFIQLDPEINSCCEECSDTYYTGKWEASYFDVDIRHTFTAMSDNPLRAICIVFLMMKGGE